MILSLWKQNELGVGATVNEVLAEYSPFSRLKKAISFLFVLNAIMLLDMVIGRP